MKARDVRTFLLGIAAALPLVFHAPSKHQAGAPWRADVLEFLRNVSVVDMPDGAGGTIRTVQLEGMNFQLVNGTGSNTDSNGAGNLLLGYQAQDEYGATRTGSHNLVAGEYNGYTGTGGMVFGLENQTQGPGAVVLSGYLNYALEPGAVVIGGHGNAAENTGAVVVGGYANRALGIDSVVSGGVERRALGDSSWAAGGLYQPE